MTEPTFLIETDDTLSAAEFEQLREDIQITPRPLPLGLVAGMHPGAVSIAIAAALEQLLASRLHCLGCVLDNRNAARAGTPDDQLPTVNAAQVVINGVGQCLERHVQFADGPIVPGKTAGGLYLPGAGA